LTAIKVYRSNGMGIRKIASELSTERFRRKALAQVIRTLREGDTLIVNRLDRLARSTRDLLNVLDQIT
jgi:DNA invertase Pin-like site-specific DNA recombinase